MKILNFTSRIIIAFFLLTGIQVFANIYYLPHIHTSSDAWETYLIVDPVPYGPAYYELTLFDDDGNVINTLTGTIPRKQELRLSLRQYGGTSGIFKTKAYPIRVRLGYIAKDSLGGGTAEFSLPSKLSMQSLMTLSNYYDKLNWSGFALFNGSEKDITVKAYGFKDGTQVVTKTFDMAPHTKVVDFFDNFLGLISFSDIDTVLFSTDYPALTGIVISGKDNDKLLFSLSYNTVPQQSVYNEEYFDGLFYQKGLANVNGNYYTFVTYNGKYYLRKIYGSDDPQFGMYELESDIFVDNIIPSSDGENLIVLGLNEASLTFVAAKITPTGETLWETEVGTNYFDGEFSDTYIIGQALSGKLIIAFQDMELDKNVVMVINEDSGEIISNNSTFSRSKTFYKAFIHSGTICMASGFSDSGNFKLQFIFYDTNGNVVKTISGDSPVNTNANNIVFDAFGEGNYIYAVLGIRNSDGNYSLYAMAVPDNDTNFSNASIVSLGSTNITRESAVYSGFTESFDSSNYDNTWVIMTSPYYYGQNGAKFLVKVKDNLPTGIYSSGSMPYKVTGASTIDGGFLIIGQQGEHIDTSIIRTKLIEKTLIGNNVLNY